MNGHDDHWRRTLALLWSVQFLSALAMNVGLIFVPFFLVGGALAQFWGLSGNFVAAAALYLAVVGLSLRSPVSVPSGALVR